MHYFIDGYNLLFRIVRSQEGESLQAQRQKIVDDLGKKIMALNIDATIIFDAYYQPGLLERSFFQNMEVIFTNERETADDCILAELKKRSNLKIETVVTSDKRLAWRCRLKGAKTQSVEEFIALLNQRYRKKLAPVKKKEAPALKSPPPQPIVEAIPQDLEAYYLAAFEASAEGEKPKKKKEKLIKGRPKKEVVETKEDAYKSEFERWLKLFENGPFA